MHNSSYSSRFRSVRLLNHLDQPTTQLENERSAKIQMVAEINDTILFDIFFEIRLLETSSAACYRTFSSFDDGWNTCWLPGGAYTMEWCTARLALRPGQYILEMNLGVLSDGQRVSIDQTTITVDITGSSHANAQQQSAWSMWAEPGSVPVDDLSWRKGHENWFFRHFDHAAKVVTSYMLNDSPLLHGKILDVGCGDGITSLSVFLRKRPELLVGLDPSKLYRNLPRIMMDNRLPITDIPDNLVFRPDDANHIPYPDDTFDVVISWGSLEHIAGGYMQTLREIKRVLKNGGLFFVHPGLYYSNFGHHLGEFTQEPFAHLTRSHEELRRLVLESQPQLMDRGDIDYTPEDFWRYYNELNPITVSRIEQELRTLAFEFWKVSLRVEDQIEYTPELQPYPLQDLATLELYLSAINRKNSAPKTSPNPDPPRPAREKTVDRFDYADYEFKLRDRQVMRDELAAHVTYFRDCRRVLDLACGSGVFLELLAEAGIPALGVERNPAVVAWVRRHGWDVVEQDVFTFLEQTTESYDGVFCSHFLEHLPFEQVLRFFELLVPRVSAAGTVVLVVPNPESIRMQLFGFWRDPEHVRFYHPELLEAICRHAGLQVVSTNRAEIPFAFDPLSFSPKAETGASQTDPQRGWLKDRVRSAYFRFLRLLRITPAADLVTVENRLRRQMHAQQDAVVVWAEKMHTAFNHMWAWPDNAVIVCRKTDAVPSDTGPGGEAPSGQRGDS